MIKFSTKQFWVTACKSYDSLSRISRIWAHEERISPAISRQHRYDVAGQLTKMETAQGDHRYGYDEARRLITAEQPGMERQAYRFDPAGNRLFDNQRITNDNELWVERVRQHLDSGNGAPFDYAESPSRPGEPFCWKDNRILDDGHGYYRHDNYGNLVEKPGGTGLGAYRACECKACPSNREQYPRGSSGKSRAGATATTGWGKSRPWTHLRNNSALATMRPGG